MNQQFVYFEFEMSRYVMPKISVVFLSLQKMLKYQW